MYSDKVLTYTCPSTHSQCINASTTLPKVISLLNWSDDYRWLITSCNNITECWRITHVGELSSEHLLFLQCTV